jgi:hypothetical protein
VKVQARETAPSQWLIYVPKLDATTGTSRRDDVERQALVMIRELTGESPRRLQIEYFPRVYSPGKGPTHDQ